MTPEFLVRRILKEAYEWATNEYEGRLKNVGTERYYLNRYTAQIHLINYLEKQYLERETNGQD
jgi:hypothetical protein